MRIMQLCLSDGHGGLELYVNRLCGLLRERGHDCRAVIAPGTRLARLLAGQDIALHELRTRVRPLPLVAARRLARIFERDQVDVVHMHWAKDLPLAALAKHLCRRPVRLIHSRHMSITRPKHDFYHRFLYHSLDRFIVLSELMRQEAVRYLPLLESAIEIVYLGVAAPDPQTLARAALARDDGLLMIGMFGRIELLKGQHLLIEAVDILRRRSIRAQARIIGHAMDEGYLAHLKQDVSRRGLTEQIEFADFHPAPLEIMPEFDVIVLATRRETFGLVLVEAMLCGVAVIGSNAGGVPEIIEDGRSGLLFEPNSAASLAHMLERLADDPEYRQSLAMAGRERAERMFSEKGHVDRIEAVLGLSGHGTA
jgi:L-malate glycosyltransferase